MKPKLTCLVRKVIKKIINTQFNIQFMEPDVIYTLLTARDVCAFHNKSSTMRKNNTEIYYFYIFSKIIIKLI